MTPKDPPSEHPLADSLGGRSFVILTYEGRDLILRHLPSLEELALKSGQSGAAQGLAYVLEEEFASRKRPVLLCFHAEASSDSTANDLLGAVLLFEYCIGKFRTGLFATGDSFGVRTVFGPESLRIRIASLACAALLSHQGRIVLTTFKSNQAPVLCDLPQSTMPTKWSISRREVKDSLLMGATYTETLAGLGKRTRTQMRSNRKKFEDAVSFTFVADARSNLPLQDNDFLEHLNKTCLDPVPQGIFNLLIRSTGTLSGGFIMGLWSQDSGWVALLGGWRQANATWVEWQMNQSGWKRFSLTTVLRTFLFEEEVALGTRRLAFHGGTSHSMAHNFLPEQVIDILAARPGLLTWFLIHAVRPLFSVYPKLSQRGNFLANALSRAFFQMRKS